IELAQHRAEGIGILRLLHGTGPADAQEIWRGVVDRTFEQAVGRDALEASDERVVAPAEDLVRMRVGKEDSHDSPVRPVVRTEHTERIAVTRAEESFDIAGRQ